MEAKLLMEGKVEKKSGLSFLALKKKWNAITELILKISSFFLRVITKKNSRSHFAVFIFACILVLSVRYGQCVTPVPASGRVAAVEGWYEAGGAWNYRKAITVNHAKVINSDQANFPLLVSFTDTDLRTVANGGKVNSANGYDLIFTSSDGSTKLDSEIERYVPATGEIVAWVKIPVLSHSADTVIYAYYGNPSVVASQENKAGVWDTNFKMVQHMEENPGGAAPQIVDSTSNALNGTAGGSMTAGNQVAGKMGGAVSFDGSDDVINFTKTIPSYVSVGAWIYLSSASTNGKAPSVIQSYGAEANDWGGFRIGQQPNAATFYCAVNTAASVSNNSGNTSALSLDAWHYLACTYDGSAVRLYVDGSLAKSVNASGTMRTPTTSYNHIGYGKSWSGDENRGSFGGLIDEARISSSARSSDWIGTEYNNQADPQSFYSISGAENLYVGEHLGYKKEINLTNNVASDLTAYQVKLTLDTAALISAGKLQSDCDDLRFAESDNTNIPYWIESGCNTSSTVIWIKTDLAASASKTVRMYYGDDAATLASDGKSTFQFFDDFDGSTLDSTKWISENWLGSGGSYSVANSRLTLQSASTVRYVCRSKSPYEWSSGVVEGKVTLTYKNSTYKLGFGGFGKDINHQVLAGPIYGGSGSSISAEYSVNGSVGSATVANASKSAYFQISRSGSLTQASYKINPGDAWTALKTNLSDNMTGLGVALESYDGEAASYDYVLVRKYAAAEPSFSAGAEVSNHIPVMHHFSISGNATQAAGTSQVLTITAMDDTGGVYAAYSGDHAFTFSGATSIGSYAPTCTDKDGNEVSFGNSTVLNFTGGVATCNLKLYKAETAAINASDGTYTATGHILGVQVAALSLNSFESDAPAIVYNDTQFSMTVTAKDAYGNATPALSGNTSISSDRGTITPDSVASALFQGYIGPDAATYAYEKDLTLTNNVASDLTGYQVKLTLDTAALVAAGKMQSDCRDLRFAATDNTNIPYWIESGCNTSSTIVWIKTNLTASSSKTIYLYYGNGNVGSAADGNSVFEFFDGFDNQSSLDTVNKWTVSGTGTNVVSGGIMTANGSNSYVIRSKTAFGTGYAVRARLKSAHYNVTTWGEYLSFANTSSNGLGALYSNTSGGYQGKYYTQTGSSSYAAASMQGWTADTYALQDIIRGASSGIFRVNDANQVTLTSPYYTGTDCNIYFRISSSGASMSADWVVVRQYASSEPTFALQLSGSSPYNNSSAGGVYTGNFILSGVPASGNAVITVTNGSVTGSTSVYVDAVDHLIISGAASQVAGATQTVTLTAVGASGNAFTNYSGDKSITFSGATAIGAYNPTCTDKTGAEVPFGTATTLSFTGGVATCTLKLYKAETAAINASDGTYTATGHTLSVAVSSAVNSLTLTAPSSIVAGEANTLTITAQDAYGNNIAAYSGDKSLTFSGATAIGAYNPTCTDKTGTEVPYGTATTLAFVDGVATCSLKLYKAETAAINASDGTYTAAGHTLPVSVSSLALSSFEIDAPDSGNAGVAFPMSIVARDAFGNAASGLAGDTTVASSLGSISPATLSASDFQSQAGPDSQTYSYRKEIFIRNNVASDLTGYQVKLTLDTQALISAGKMQGDCDDLRFAETDNINIPYWIESGCNTASTTVWIKTDLSTSASKSIYMYYGNESVSSEANGAAVFELFDDFAGSSLDAGKWTSGYFVGENNRQFAIRNTGYNAPTVSAGNLLFGGTRSATDNATEDGVGSGWWGRAVTTTSGIAATNFIVEARMNFSQSSSGAYANQFGSHIIGVGKDKDNLIYGRFGYTDSLSLGREVANVWGGGNPVTFTHTGAAWSRAVLTYLDNGTVTYQINDSPLSSYSVGQSLATRKVSLAFDHRAPSAAVTQLVDWVMVRKYAAVAPTVTFAAGTTSEGSYSGNFTISGVSASGDAVLTVTNGSVSGAATVYIDTLHHFNITGSAAQAAGGSQTLTLTAVGGSGNTLGAYSGDKAITFSGATAIGAYNPTCTDKTEAEVPFGTATTLAFVDGVATCSLKLYKAETAAINASDGTYAATGHTLSVSVSSSAGNLTLSAPSTVAAGASNTVTLNARDGYGNLASEYTGDKAITFSGATSDGEYIPTCTDKTGAEVPFGMATTIAFSGGTGTCNMKVYKLQTFTLGATDGTYSANQTITVSGAPLNRFDITAPASTRSGNPFALSIVPRDAYGNYAGDITENTTISINHGTINGEVIPPSSFQVFIGPDSENYTYRKSVALQNNVASDLTGYQVKLTLDTQALISAGKMQGDCDDLRFAETDNINIPYWIESGCNTASTTVWIKTDLSASATKTVYMYYGNADASSQGNADSIFYFYDDFENGLGKWAAGTNGAVFNEGGDNVLRLTATGSLARSLALPAYDNLVLESKFKFATFGSYGPRLTHELSPLTTYIESQADGSGSAWHQTWLGAGATQIARAAPSWSAGTQYLSRLITTSSTQKWEVGSTVLSGNHVRSATVSEGSFSFYTWDNGNDLRIYWVKARQYAATEPTVAFQLEEARMGAYTANFTISGILQDTDVTISVQNAAVTSTAPILVESADNMSYLAVTGSGAQAAGETQDITITAIGDTTERFILYTGEKTVTFSGAAAAGSDLPTCNGVPFGPPMTLAFEQGIATCSLALYKAESAAIDVSDGTYAATGHALAVAVSPGALQNLEISAPASAASGTPFSASVTAKDAYGNLVTSLAASVIVSTSRGSISPSSIAAAEFSGDGAYSGDFTISSAYTSGSATISFSSSSVNASAVMELTGADEMDHLSITAGSSQTAGSAQNITVTAIGKSGNTFTSYAGEKTLTFAGANPIGAYGPTCGGTAFGTPASFTFVNGAASCALMLYKAEAATVSVSDGTYSASRSIAVSAAAISALEVGAPASAVSAAPFSLTLTARDAFGNATTNNVSSSTSISVNHGAITPNSLSQSAFSAGGVYTANYTVSQIYIDTDVMITFTKGAISSTVTIPVTGVNQTNHFTLSGSATQNAGQIQTINLTAINDSGNVDTSYMGDKTITFSGSLAVGGHNPTCTDKNGNNVAFGSPAVISFINGVGSCSMALYKAGASSINVSDGTYAASGYTLGVSVAPGPFSVFALTAPSTAVSHTPFAVTLTSQDAYGNNVPVSGATGISVDQGSVSPSAIESASFVNNVYSGNFTLSGILSDSNVALTFQNAGVTRSTTVAVSGTDDTHHLALTGSAVQIAGQAQTVTVSAVNYSGGIDASYTGDKMITFSGASAINGHAPTSTDKAGAAVAFGTPVLLSFENGIATTEMILYQATAQAINVNDGSNASTGYPLAVNVSAAALQSFSVTAPNTAISGTSFSLTVTAKDAYGNTTTDLTGDISVSADQGTVSQASLLLSDLTDDGIYTGAFTLSDILTDRNVIFTVSCGSATGSKTLAVTGVDETHHFVLSGSATQTAGETQTLTVTAIAVSGGTDLDYIGDHTFIFAGANPSGGHNPTCTDKNDNAVAFGTSTTLNFTAGVATCNLALYKAETATINASEGAYDATGHTLSVAVAAAPVSSFAVTSPTAAVSGTPFAISLLAKDAYANDTTSVAEDVTLTADHGTVSLAAISAASFQTNGAYSSNLTISDIAEITSVTLSFASGGISSTRSVSVHQVDAMDHLRITGSASQVAGESQTVTVTAIGVSGNVFSGYVGEKILTFSGANALGAYAPTCNSAAFGAPTALNFTNGVATCILKLYEAAPADIGATDGTYTTGGNTLSVSVSPAAVSSFTVTSPASIVSGTPFSLSLSAQDAYGNTASVSGATTLAVNAGTVSPASLAEASFSGGSFTGDITIGGILTDRDVTLTLQRPGLTQNVSLAVTGVDAMSHFVIAGNNALTAGTVQTFTITAVGQSGNTYSAYAGNHDFTFSGASSIGAYVPYATDKDNASVSFGSLTTLNFVGGVATCDLVLYRAGTASISLAQGAYSLASAFAVTVSPAALYSFAGRVPTVAVSDTPFLITLAAKDQYGNTISSVANDVALSVDHGTLSAPSLAASSFVAGVFTGNIAILGIGADTPVVLDIQSGSVRQSASLTVTGADYVHHLSLSSALGVTAAGAATEVSITLKTVSDETYTAFSGDKTVTFSGANSLGAHIPTCMDKNGQTVSFGQSAVLSFINGVATSNLVLYEAGTSALAISDAIHGDGSLAMTVSAGPIASLHLTAASSVNLNEAFPLTITALDLFGNATTDLAEDVSLSTDAGSLDTSAVAASSFASGGTYIVTLTVFGLGQSQDVVITAASGAIAATAAISVVVPAAPSTGGAAFIPPKKPSIAAVAISRNDGKLSLSNLPPSIIQFAISSLADFASSSWEDVETINEALESYSDSPRFYIKFRTAEGGVSDVIIYRKPVIEVTLLEGDIARTASSCDVYIVKYAGGKQFRRLILSPRVFSSYQHLKWENVKIISSAQMSSYAVSSLVYVKEDPNTYQLFPGGDEGERRILFPNEFRDVDSIYEINEADRDSYRLIP